VPVRTLGPDVIQHRAQYLHRQPIEQAQLGEREFTVGLARAQHQHHVPGERGEHERIDTGTEWRTVHDDAVIAALERRHHLHHRFTAEHFRSALEPGSARDHREVGMPTRPQNLFDACGAAQAVEQPRLPVDTEAPVQFASPDVTIHQHHSVPRFCEAQREVGRH
jgi:hypothetical protein